MLRRIVLSALSFLLLCFFLVLAPAPRVHAATCTVTTNANSGAGSLREKIGDASCATINFNGNYTIVLASMLTISRNVTITGAGHTVTVSGNDAVRVLWVNAGVTFDLQSLTIAHGTVPSYFDSGGGIYNSGGTVHVSNSTFSANQTLDGGDGGAIYNDGGTLSVTNSTFANNHGGNGGGISNEGTARVANSTFTGNSSASLGGALNNYGDGNTLIVTNSTLSGNSANSTAGGGIFSEVGTATFYNSIIANSPAGNNCGGGDTPGGSNNLADDATCGSGFTQSSSILLSALGSYGGSTQTLGLLPGAPAIDAGDDAICAAAVGSPNYGAGGLDQRGISRSGFGAHCDIGAFESRGFTVAKTGGDNQSTTTNSPFPTALGLTVTANNAGEPVNGGKVTFAAPSSGASTNPATNIATIASGAVSQSVIANNHVGAFTVTVSARGATSANFTLTNNPACSPITVTNPLDAIPGSLRRAITNICQGGTINFNGDYTIVLSTGELSIDKDMTIDGTGYNITIDGNHVGRVFHVNYDASVVLNALTVTNGYVTGENNPGGGIYNDFGRLTVTNSTIISNSTQSAGGGIYSIQGNLTVANSTLIFNTAQVGGGISISTYNATSSVTDSTFISNTATLYGGGIENASGTLNVTNSTFATNSATMGGGFMNRATANVTHSTFSGNRAASGGGGVDDEEYLTLSNSIIANSPAGGNCTGSPLTGANNLADDGTCGAGFANSSAILLGTLNYYGGGTKTFPLLPGSDAIDAASTNCPITDQRGVTRSSPTCDIGAFESRGFVLGNQTGSSQSANVNTPFATPLGLTVTANSAGEPVNGGKITFTAPSSGPSTNPAINTATIASGAVSKSVTANGIGGGSYPVFATAPGANTLLFGLTNIGPAATTTTLTATPSLSTLGQTVTLTATVSPSAATGTVQFYADGATLGSPVILSSGRASMSTLLNAGGHVLLAIYSGNTNYATSTSNGFSLTVNNPTPTLSTLNPTSAQAGGADFALTLTGTNFITNSVVRWDGGNRATTYISSTRLTATIPGTEIAWAHHTSVAVYNPTPGGGTSNTLQFTVNPASTTTTLASSTNPSTCGQSVTFTATVNDSTSGTPTGTATFYDNGAVLGTGSLNASGVATYATTSLSVGSHAITATYSGDTNFSASTGTLAGGQAVNVSNVVVMLVSSPSPISWGQTAVFTATIGVRAASAQVTRSATACKLTGTVAFKEGATTLNSANVDGNCQAVYSTTTLAAGTHTVTAQYGGDANYGNGTSSPVMMQVNRISIYLPLVRK